MMTMMIMTIDSCVAEKSYEAMFVKIVQKLSTKQIFVLLPSKYNFLYLTKRNAVSQHKKKDTLKVDLNKKRGSPTALNSLENKSIQNIVHKLWRTDNAR